VRYRGK